MSAATSIQWTDKTWNPVTGCAKVSPGCAHCYAEGVAVRFWGKQYPRIPVVWVGPMKFQPPVMRGCIAERETRPRQFTDVMTHEDRLLEPLSWRKPAKVFVNSMSDLFHEDVPDGFIDHVFGVMALAPQHTFQILTKRAERMRRYVSDPFRAPCVSDVVGHHHGRADVARPLIGQNGTGVPIPARWPLPNVWLGTSVENQHFADERIPLLLQTPAAVRFISAEPLLGPVDLRTIASVPDPPYGLKSANVLADGSGLHWVIVGGESGSSARPCDLAWIRQLVQDCSRSQVKVFVKQVGADPREQNPYGKGHPLDGLAKGGYRLLLKDRKGGDPLEWPVDLNVRQFPEVGRHTP